ncbi:MAG: sugar ABC transporter substrate-binding protein [Spirochaetales bacterium]|nr:sugar ABC transporter substrate-binding protein [Spirochaetales bacterium]
MKKLLTSLLLLAVLASGMAFAAGQQDASDEDKMVIGYATKSSTSPFWIILNQGAQDAADELGVELIMLGPPKENDVVGQLAVLEDLINQEVDALMVAACDSVGVAPAVQKAKDEGISVIAIGDEILGAEVDSFLATNNYNAAVVAAEWMAEELGGEGNVVLLNGMIAQGSGKGRYEGFRDTIEAKYPNIDIVFSKDCAWEDEKALAAFEDAMAANDKIDGVFVGWDGAALAAHTALTEAGRIDETLICGFDCYPQSLKFMKEGTFEANIAQSPYKMGYEGIMSAYKAAMGETLPKVVDTGVQLVTPENVDQYIADNGVTLP